MRVLIACEFSGTVRDAFIKAGHKAVSCDILPTDMPGPHIQDDLLEVLKYTNSWDLMIAHPPCTYLSNAGARHLYPKGELNQERLNKGLVAKQFFMTIYNANIPMICIENPIPSKVYELPKYNQVIQPYEYGHEFSKKTCLWLKNLPPLMATMYVEKTESTKVPGNWFNKGGKDRQKNRAKTFQGIADAMAQQWGN
jgi:hypothetical protein